MIKPFKFLSTKKIFQFEITGRITWVPLSFMGTESFDTQKSNLIKEWLSEFFYGYHPNGFNKEKYFPEFDRTCEIIQSGLDTVGHQRVFTAIIRIYRMVNQYMEINLMYPI
jgi:hypothetical protein